MKNTLLALGLIISLSGCEFKVNMQKDQKKEEAPKAAALPFPLKTDFTDDYLRATFWKCNYSSAGSSRAYWVILPNILRPTAIDPKVIPGVGLTEIGVYNTIDKTLPYIEVMVYYEEVKTGVNPADWLLEKVKITGETVLHKNEFKFPNGQSNLDVLTFKKVANGERVVSRLVGLQNGNDYFVIKVSCNEKDYAAQANTIFHVVSHWNINR